MKTDKKTSETESTSDRLEITLSGSGGQGIILMAKILAEASSIYDNKEVVMAQSYGAEARGGASKADVIISAERIDYPKAIRTDILVSLTREALSKYGKSLEPKDLLVVDSTFIEETPSHLQNVFKAPFSSLAVKTIGAPMVANIIALGSLAAITCIVSKEALTQALIARVSSKVLEIDKVALNTGFKIAEESGFRWKK